MVSEKFLEFDNDAYCREQLSIGILDILWQIVIRVTRVNYRNTSHIFLNINIVLKLRYLIIGVLHIEVYIKAPVFEKVLFIYADIKLVKCRDTVGI